MFNLCAAKILFFIFLAAHPGVGKTASVAMMTVHFAKGAEELKQFDLVWTIRLKDVDKTSSLAELLIAQHDRLKVMEVPPEQVKSILKGRTKHRTLLILDGYDKYALGTNKDIDEAIESGVGNCVLVLTSRPEYLSKEIRDKMDEEVQIEGFSEKGIEKCSQLYLQNKKRSESMLKQAKDTGLYQLLHIPIISLLSCLVFVEHHSLPKTRTEIYRAIFDILIDRTVSKNFSPGIATDIKNFLDAFLFTLGECSWQGLQKGHGQLELSKVHNEVYLFSINYPNIPRKLGVIGKITIFRLKFGKLA